MAEHPNFSTAFEGGTYLVTTNPEKKYKQIELIGEGGYGAVLLCRRRRDRKLYAVKIIGVKEDKDDLKKQLKEMEILAALQGSPYIVGFVECLFVKHTRFAEWLVKDLKSDRHLWCVMELCGKDMWTSMKDMGRPLSAEQTLAVAAQLFLAMEFIHSRKIVHRDIKGLNVLLTQSGRIKLCDFGFSEYAHDEIHPMMQSMGTTQWMAPEMFTDAIYQYEVDVWATGITMLEMYRQRVPFESYDNALLWGAISSLATDSEEMQRTALDIPRPNGSDKQGRLAEYRLDVQVTELAFRCLNSNQRERPTAPQLMEIDIVVPYIAELRALDTNPCMVHEKGYDGEEECRCKLTFAPLRKLFTKVEECSFQYHQDMKVAENVARS